MQERPYGVSNLQFRKWHNTCLLAFPSAPPNHGHNTIKNLEVPELKTYKSDPGEGFWKSFPFRPLPKKPQTPLNIEAFKGLIKSVWKDMSFSQRNRAALVITDLTQGANTLAKTEQLGAIECPNRPGLENAAVGRLITDQICSWIKSGCVAGPFRTPPLPDFRVNSMFAIIKKSKCRPILNMSSPKGSSYNDSIDEDELFKIRMATPKQVADQLTNYGPEATMSKLDHVNAFKLIPVHPCFWRCQGFRWLDNYFIETQVVFGSTSGPSIYD